MATIKLRQREGAMVSYAVYDDDGHYLKSSSRNVEQEIAEARQRKVSLLKVLAERESVVQGAPAEVEALPPLPDAPKAQDHTHEEFGYPLAEHDHPPHEHDLPIHNHPVEKHVHDPHDHSLKVHSHELPEHPHANLEGRLGQIEADFEAYQGHGHEHDHPPHTHDDFRDLAQGIIQLRRMIEDVTARLDERSRPEHEHPEYQLAREKPAAHSHPELAHDHEHSHPFVVHEHPQKEHGHLLEPHAHDLPKHEHEAAQHEHDLPAHDHPLEKHEHDLLAHGHELPDHPHPIPPHQHGHEHEKPPEHEHEINPVAGHEHPIPPHVHEYAPHSHEMQGHSHPLSDHTHPEITGMFSPEVLKEAGEKLEEHTHRFDTMRDDGKGWRCGICGHPKEEVILG